MLQPAERDALDEREDVALEGGEVDEFAVCFVPLSRLPFAGYVRCGAPVCCEGAMRRITARRFRFCERG